MKNRDMFKKSVLCSLSLLFFIFSLSLNAQVILSDPGTTYNNTDAATSDTYGPVSINGCTTVQFSLDYSFSLPWAGSGNMESADECNFAGTCAGDPNFPNTPGGPCETCWDFLWVRYFVDGVVVFEEIIGDAGTTDAEQNGTISFEYCAVGTGASNVSIVVGTQTWAANESVTFSNITVTCIDNTPSLSGIGPLCENDAAVALGTNQGGISGNWSGTGVSANAFDPSVGAGNYTLTFEPLPAECANDATTMVVVNPATTPNLGSYGPFCEDDASISLPATPDGVSGTWSGPGVSGTTFDPSAAGTGSATITFSPSGGQCVNPPAPISIQVDPVVTPVLDPIGPLCISDGSVTLNTMQNGVTGTWSGTGVNNNSFNPVIAGVGSTMLTFMPSGGCANDNSIFVTVLPTTTPNLTPIGPLCETAPGVPLNPTQDGVTGTWSGGPVQGGAFVPSLAGAGPSTITFTPDPGQCANADDLTIVVNPSIAVTLDPLGPFCLTDGSVTLNNTQDGVSGSWSGNGVSGNIFDPSIAMTGSHVLTFTPNPGECATGDNITVVVDPSPMANPAGPLNACGDGSGQAAFDLTLLNNAINGTPGATINWSTDIGGMMIIGDPTNFVSNTNTVFATVVIGGCTSNTITVQLNVDPQPNINASSFSACDDGSGQATFDLTDPAVTNQINGGNGNPVSYFTDPAANNPIANPGSFTINSSPTVIYATVQDPSTLCPSASAQITLTILPAPMVVDPMDLTGCDEGGNQATFDLTSLNNTVDPTGTNTVVWYTDPAGNNPIANPGSFVSGNTTVYVNVTNNLMCSSAIVAVNLMVSPAPSINPTNPNPVCDNGSGQGTFDLTQVENIINGGSGEPVNWYTDPGLNNQIFNTSAYTGSGIIYVTVGTAPCLSGPEPITLNLLTSPTGNDISDTFCGDAFGQVTIDLTAYDIQINGTPGNTIIWYTDPGGNNPIFNPTAFTTGTTTVYAEVSDGTCTSITLAQFNITVNAGPQAFPPTDPLTACIILPFDATINLTTVEGQINGGTGFPVNWFLDQAATMPITDPSTFEFNVATSVWVTVTDPVTGCETPMTVEVPLQLAFAPNVNNPGPQTACDIGNGTAIFDLTTLNGIIGGGNNVTYYSDPGLNNEILNPSNYQTAGGPVYVVVNDGICDSEVESFNLNVTPAPIANPLNDPFEFCDDGTNTALVDLTIYNTAVLAGQGGQVNWYTDQFGNNLIFTPDLFTINGPTTVYAEVDNGNCQSSLLPVQLNLLPIPQGSSTTANECPDFSGFAVFDLTDFLFQSMITGGTGDPITFYTDPGTNNEIINPDAFTIDMTTQIFAVIVVNGCPSLPIPIDLIVDDAPMANGAMLELCDEGNGTATFNLDDPTLQTIINGGTGAPVNFYQDAIGNTPINNTAAFVASDNTQIFATVGGGDCESGTVIIDLNVIMTPNAVMPNDPLSLCDDGSGTASFNLNTLNTTINGGNGNPVNWFTDENANQPIADPFNFVSGTTTVYANISQGICTSETVAVNLQVNPIPTANSTELEACESSSNQATFDLNNPITVDEITGGALGVSLSWYEDIGATQLIANPGAFTTPSTMVYVVVSDGVCESAPTLVDLTVLPAPVVLPAGPIIACDEGNGSATIDLTQYDDQINGSQNFMVTWYNDNGGNSPIADPTNYVAMDGDAVFAAVTNDMTLCESSTVTISIEVPSPIDANINIDQQISCFSFADGSLDLEVTGGTPPFNFDWSDDNFDGIEDPSGLTAGTYTVNITDDIGCVGTASVTINEPDELQINCSEFAPVSTVGGMDGIASIDITGGTAPYTLDYSGAANGSVTANSDGNVQITGLISGNYTLTITDANGCMTDCSFTINEPGCDLSLQITGTNVACNGDATGSIDLTINGGSGNFTIDWNDDNLDGIEDPTNLMAGNYVVIVTDDQNCNSTTSINITEPTALALNCSEGMPVSTVGGSDGVGAVNITGGTAPYTIDYTGAAMGSQMAMNAGLAQITNLPAGTYNITVTDANGCPSTCTFTITDPQCAISLTANVTNVDCFGASTGAIDLEVMNGQTPLTFDWSDDQYDGQEDLMNLPTGTYEVTVTGSDGCAASTSVMITAPAELLLNCSEDTPVSALGASDGIAGIDITGGTAPYTIDYTGAAMGSQMEMNAGLAQITNLPAGTYNITVTDANGCQATCTLTITDPQCAISLTANATNVDCFGASTGAIDLEVMNGQTPLTFDWSDDQYDGQEDLMNLPTGTYEVTVSGSDGCTASTSVMITAPSELLLNCSEDTPVSALGASDGIAGIDIQGGTAPYTIDYTGAAMGSQMAMNAGLAQITNLPAGTYNITVTDANGCQATCTLTITDPQCAISLTANATNVDCFGASTGSIDLEVMNGQTPLTFDWSDDQYDGQEDLMNLPTGTYAVTVTGSDGCTASTSVMITAPAELLLNCSEDTPVSTVGASDGIAGIDIQGGTAPYTIDYTGAAMGSQMAMTAGMAQITNLPAGTYNITVTDANGCPSTCTLTITDPQCAISLTANATNVDCFGASTGAIDLEVMNGQTPLTFDWSDDQYDGQEDLMNLPTGTYEVTVTGSDGCAASTSVMITAPAELLLNCSEDAPVSTVGASDGIAGIDIQGGTAPYTIDYIGAATGSQMAMNAGLAQITNLPAGTYNITVTDANGCPSTCTLTITDPQCAISLTANATNVDCFGASTGAIDLEVMNGQTPLTFDWSDDQYDGQEDLMNLPTGTYAVTVTGSDGCTASTSVMITAPAELLLNCSEDTPVSTVGASDGIAGIDIQGGTAPYTIDYTGAAMGSQMAMNAGLAQITNLPAGTYNITVTDANGCQEICEVTITEPNCVMTIELEATDISCNGANDGTINLSIFDGAGPFDIDWNFDQYDGMQFITGLSANTYAVTVTDANGCIAIDSVVIDEPIALTLTCAEDSPVSTVGGNDGVALITFSGGTAPYNINYDGPISGMLDSPVSGGFLVTDLMAGTYTLVIEDANACTIECMFEITEPSCNLTLEIEGTDVSCFGAADGSIDLTVNGATPPLTFDWLNDALDGIEDPSGLGGGMYTVKVTDVFGCTESISVTIAEPMALLLDCEVVSNVSTEGGSDGSANIAASGGTPPFSVSYTGPINGTIEPVMAENLLEGLPAGNYSVVMTDANGCTVNCDFEITEPVCAMVLSLTANDLSCFGAADGTIALEIINGTPPYEIDWSDDQYDGLQDLDQLLAGTYQVQVTDVFGCISEAQVVLNEPLEILVDAFGNSSGCFGSTSGEIIIEAVQGGTPPYEVSLDGTFFESLDAFPFVYSGQSSGNYTLMIQDANDCIYEMAIELEETEELILDLGEDEVIILGDSIQLDPQTNFVVDSFVWSPQLSLGQADQLMPFSQPLENITYTLTAFNAEGCFVIDQINIIVQRPTEVYVPTAFSPDGDGSNDVFMIFAGNSVAQVRDFQIYDRWGDQMYRQGPFAPNDPQYGWDGTHRGQEMNTGIYVYFAEIEMVDGRIEMVKGDVLLLR